MFLCEEGVEVEKLLYREMKREEVDWEVSAKAHVEHHQICIIPKRTKAMVLRVHVNVLRVSCDECDGVLWLETQAFCN